MSTKVSLAGLSKTYQKNGAHNEETMSRRSNKSNKSTKSRVVDNNVMGKNVDKITQEQRKPDTKAFSSIYRDDFKPDSVSQASPQKAQGQSNRSQSHGNVHIVNLPNQQQGNHQEAEPEEGYDPNQDYMPDHTYSHFSKTVDGKTFNGIPYMNPDEAKYFDEMRTVVYKLKYKGPRGSIYKKDFVEHPIEKKGGMKRDFYSTQNHGAGVDYVSNYRTDFKNWKMKPPKKEKLDFKPVTNGMAFGARSSYRQEFVNWGSNLTALDKPKQPKTVIEDLPFIGKTTYGEGFRPGVGEVAGKVDNNLWGKSPLYPSIPFLGESVSMKTYKPFKVGPVNPNEHKPKDAPQPGKSFNSQYHSEYHNNFLQHPDQMNPREFLIDKFKFY